MTPIVLTITTCLIVFGTKDVNPIWKSILTFAFVALNDIAIKLYSGGSHDNEGLGWVHLLLFVGLLPTFGFLLIAIVKDKQASTAIKIIGVAAFSLLIIIHLHFLATLDLDDTIQYID